MPEHVASSLEPPDPPKFAPRFKVYAFQYIAIPILMLFPLLAVLGVLGETRATAQETGSSIQLEVDYPDRMHAGMTHEFEIRVTNVTTDVLSNVEILVSQSYIQKFAAPDFLPDVTALTPDHAIVGIGDLPPGHTRLVLVSLEGLAPGTHDAEVSARAANTNVVTTQLSTQVFP